MENDINQLRIRQMKAQEKAVLIQAIDIYGCDTITKQFIVHLPEVDQIVRLTGIILELDEQLWVRALPHAPGNLSTKELPGVGMIEVVLDDEEKEKGGVK